MDSAPTQFRDDDSASFRGSEVDHRPTDLTSLRAVDVAWGLWFVWVPGYFYFLFPPVDPFTSFAGRALSSVFLACLFVMLIAMLALIAMRQWRRLATFIVGTTILGFVIGTSGFDRCPHASYVTVYGVSLAISGNPCGNLRDFSPGWMKVFG